MLKGLSLFSGDVHLRDKLKHKEVVTSRFKTARPPEGAARFCVRVVEVDCLMGGPLLRSTFADAGALADMVKMF